MYVSMAARMDILLASVVSLGRLLPVVGSSRGASDADRIGEEDSKVLVCQAATRLEAAREFAW